MSTATELLRRALDALDDHAYTPEWYQAKQDIRAFLAAEPEADPDDKDEIHQMQLTAISLAARGNWKKGDKISPKYETPALYDVAKLYADASKFVPEPRSWETHEEFIRELAAVNGIPIDENLFTGSSKPEPSRKPMTEEEIDEELETNEYYCAKSFADGVRFAEKHHFGIGINLSDPDSIDLQSRCRGDKL